MKGIKELKEAVVFIGLLATAIDKSTKDGLSYDDAPTFLPVMMQAPQAFAGVDEIPAEFKDLDDAERKEIVVAIKDNLDLEDDVAENVAEQAFATVLDIVAVVQRVRGLT